MGSINLLDHLREINHLDSIERIVLIEPSARAIERGTVHLEAYRSICNFEVVSHACLFEDIHPEQIQISNVEDAFTSSQTSSMWRPSTFVIWLDSWQIQQSDDLLVCVGPFYANNRRMDRLFDFSKSPTCVIFMRKRNRDLDRAKMDFKARITELKHQSESALKKSTSIRQCSWLQNLTWSEK